MSKLSRIFAVTLAAVFSLSTGLVCAADADEVDLIEADASALQAEPASSPWPVQVNDNGRTFLIYQPQVDKWAESRIEGRSAVSVRNDAGGQQNFGVVYFSARATLDPGPRTVTVSDAVVSKADFPAVAAGAEDYLSVLRAQFAAQSWQVAQESLQSDMEIDKYARQAAKQPLKNDPPRILYSERPAILVPVDGAPVLRQVADTGLMRVANTRALILQDKATSRYYLFVSDHWMEAPALEGPWLPSAAASAQLEQAKQIATQQDQVDLLQADADEDNAASTPVSVVVSTTPTELLQTNGPAQYSPIEGTQLLYVTNSPDKLFLDLRTQNHYALISGRWYRATALAQGQWNYVPAASLPGDFAMIPAGHPTEIVRAAVPGTPQAREAVIANSIPQVATVARNAAGLEVAYDGNPVFQAIEGTSLQNAVNSPVPVIRVGEESFYALDNGVWFVASSPFGPWAVTSHVPAVIYSIPPNSALYYVTYVRVYDSTPEVVYVGYTPGYVGSYVSGDSVVVYGTGWPYRPWIGSVWYGAPVTWGFGFSFFHSWWHPYPWHYGHRVAWASPRPYYHPWWGPWHAPAYGHRGFVAAGVRGIRPAGPGVRNVGRIYDRWDRRSVVWNGPRAIASQPRPGLQAVPRARPGTGFVAGSDNRWHRLGDDGGRDRARRDSQVRSNVANSPAAQMPRADRTPGAVQSPWRRTPDANQDGRRAQSPSFGGNDRRPEARPFPPRALEQRQGGEGGSRTWANGRPNFDRSRVDAQQARPAPQRMPPVAGVPIERSPSQPHRAMPQRSFSAPSGRIERPAMANPGRIERPAAANMGRSMDRPSFNASRNMDHGAARPQARGNSGHGQSNSGGGGFRGGDRNR